MKPPMTPDDFRAARRSLGLTQSQIAVVLGYTGGQAHRMVRRWEKGGKPIPQCVADRVRLLMVGTKAATRPAVRTTPEGAM